MNPNEVKNYIYIYIYILTLVKTLMIKILYLKLTITFFQIQNHFCQRTKGYTLNWSEEVLVIKKLKLQFHGQMLLIISMVKKLLDYFMKRN